MATAGGAGFFLANALGFVATSAVAYFCTAAAGLRLKPRSHPDDFEDGCDLWLHHCAASSSDGTFTWAKEKLCTMAAPASCAQNFDSKQRSPSLQGNIKSKRGLSLAPGGRITKSAIIAGSMSATDKLQLPSGLVVSPVWALVGCNSLAWASVYMMCVAAKKARARRSRQARSLRVNAAAGGGGVSMAVGDATGVADTAAGGGAGNARVGPSREVNAPSAEVAQQAPMASGSLHVAALSPGLVSPPKLQREKLVGGMSAARSSLSSSSSSKVLSGSEDTVVQCSNMVSAEDIGGLFRKTSPRGTKFGPPAPAAVLPRSRSAPSVFTSLEIQVSNNPNRKQVGAAEDPSRNDTATAHLGMRFLEARRELQNVVGGGPRNGFASAISSVANPEVYSTHSGSPVPDSIGSEFSVSDEPGSQPRASVASVSDVPSSDVQAAYEAFLDTSSAPSTTYSACWNVLEEGYAKSTSLHGVSDLEIDVPPSVGSGGTVTQDTDCVIGGTPDGEMSTHDTLEPWKGESKGDSNGRRTSWVEPSTGSPVGATVGHPGVGAIQCAGFHATRSRLSGLRGGVEEAKGPFAFEISRSGKYQQLGPHACSDVIGEGVAEAKGDSACAELLAGVGPEVRAHALSDGIQGGVAECEWDDPSDRLPPPSDDEVQEVARLNGILDEALRVLGSDE